MRPKLAKKQKHTARGVSLPPELWKGAFARANRLNLGFSQYVQELIKNDLENNIVAQVIAKRAMMEAA